MYCIIHSVSGRACVWGFSKILLAVSLSGSQDYHEEIRSRVLRYKKSLLCADRTPRSAGKIGRAGSPGYRTRRCYNGKRRGLAGLSGSRANGACT